MSVRSPIDDTMLDEAIAWQRALDREDADWDGYMAWLEADPRHRQAYDELALLDRIVDERAPDIARLVPEEPQPVIPEKTRRRPWLVGSIAAAIAVAVAIPALRPQQPDITYATGYGQTRHVDLGQGVAIDLAPATKLVSLKGDPTTLRLASGEAFFTVAHDPNRALSIAAGDYAVTDIGTTFAMALAPEAVTVAVAEGNVSVVPADGAPTKVGAGQQLVAQRAAGHAEIKRVATANVGSWRHGRLIYNSTPLSIVAADLSRYSGKTVTVDPRIKDQEFSGVLAIGDGSKLFDNIAALMAISYQADHGSVRLVPAAAR